MEDAKKTIKGEANATNKAKNKQVKPPSPFEGGGYLLSSCR